MKNTHLSLLVVFGLILLAGSKKVDAQSAPTPREVIAGLIGNWTGKEIAYYNGKAVLTETFTEKIEPLGTNGLGYIATVTLHAPNQKPITGISWTYDTGTIMGTSSQKGVTFENLTGTWSINGRTISADASVSASIFDFTMHTETVVIDEQTVNSVGTSSTGVRVVGTMNKIVTPAVNFTQPITPLAYSYRANFPLSASSPSGGVITYKSSDPGVISIIGHTATLKGVGTVTITATVAAKANYTTASASCDVTVNKSTPALNMSVIPVQTYSANKVVTLKATSSVGLAPVTFSCLNPAIGTVIGNRLRLVGSGTTTVSAYQAGNKFYNASTATQTLSVQ